MTFGKPIAVDIALTSRREVLDFARTVMDAIGRLYKVLPTAVIANAMRPSITRRDLEGRADTVVETLRANGANLGVESGAEAVDAALELLENTRYRRRRAQSRARARPPSDPLLRAHSRSSARLPLQSHTLMYGGAKAFFYALSRSTILKRLASRYGPATSERFVSRFIAGETIEAAIEVSRRLQSQGLLVTLDRLGERVRTAEDSTVATREYMRLMDVIADAGIERNISLQLTQLGIDVDRATCVDNLRRLLEPAARREFFVRIDMEKLALHGADDRDLRNAVGAPVSECWRGAAVVSASH